MKNILFLILLIILGFVTKAQQQVELCPENQTTFTYYSNASVNSGQWVWTLSNDTISHISNTTIHWVDTGLFTIRVSFKGECGDDWKIYRVHVINCIQSAIFFYNAFTPNSDGINDYWSPICRKIKELHYSIYNRWGEKVFESNSPNKRWDGKYKGMPADMANYVFIANWVHQDGRKGFQKGNLLLIR
jgi:gliding motility-associated-like protein